MTYLTKAILKTIYYLRTTPTVLVSGGVVDYKAISTYINGYIDGINEVLRINLMRRISEWFQNRVDQKDPIFLTGHIKYRYKDATDEELKKILLDTLEAYFIENPEWYKNTNN
ncbi:MAG: hypothetical protein ACK5WF_24530 [Cyclobacteriaceae bacterium]|jgi:hypothetical protein